ncbi:hypothetical protein SAMN02745687_00415 [Lachnospiraceae bacterium NK3A20]|nr:hypothetical protein SAMN02745687_00415 [Lachnospiraceae bacterium NK3A20]
MILKVSIRGALVFFMEKIVAQGILYDFYGQLLTSHQREVYEQVVYNDMSLNEIASAEGISKQAVSDLIKRTTAQMQRYEDTLGMIDKFNKIRRSLDELEQEADKSTDPLLKQKALRTAEAIRKELI